MTEAIQQVNKYLKGELPFDVGVRLFISLSKNKSLARHFSLSYSKEREQKLKYELQKYTKQYEAPSKLQSFKQNNDIKSSTGNEPADATLLTKASNKDIPVSDRFTYFSSSNDVPGLESKLHKQRKDLYRQRGHYHGKLHNATTDDERHQLAIRIMDSQDQINKLNRDIRLIEAGSVPSKYLKKDKTADEFVRIKNLKMYISRFEKKIESCTSLSEKAKHEAILEKHKAELKRHT